ncbi:cytochrome c-type heme lyase [Pseudomonas aeruginosa]|uniref:cytochrome c-type heme lyase n=1 Tax=Pseudomonas aeruginosa TaxID=287 RepID=UPI001FB62F3F|nr:cytochrome c-type heme lyase [Pseudomonas aeruginosa]MEB6194848.1 cytochrome c-type heme lyase [Pseudomonas aeruginosa]
MLINLALFAKYLDEKGMIRERIVAIWEYKKLTAKKLEDLSGIDREKWYALRKGGRRANEDDIESMVAIHPEYALWLVSGQIAPEAGQTSPEYDEANRKLLNQHVG